MHTRKQPEQLIKKSSDPKTFSWSYVLHMAEDIFLVFDVKTLPWGEKKKKSLNRLFILFSSIVSHTRTRLSAENTAWELIHKWMSISLLKKKD